MRLRIKDICDYVSRGTTPDYVDEGANKVMNQATFSKGWIDESNIRYTSKTNKGARIMKGDLLMASTGGGVLGKVFFFDDDDSFYADSHVTIMRNSKGANLMKYLYYYFYLRYDEINATMVKGSTNQTELQRNYLLSYELDVPTLAGQQRMVTYLDTKLSEIDHQVSLLTSKRDAYLRLKKSIINHAVTRGLNPNVKMKDSGIEWIGEVPEHWEVKRMKDIFFERKELSLTGEEDLLSVSEFYGVARRKDKMNSDEEFESRADSLVGYKICKAHDLVINIMLAWKTGLGISDNDVIVSPAYAVYEGRNIASHFYHYLLRSGMYVKEFKRHSKGIIDSRLRLYNDRFNNISAIYPPLPEQRAIATYLDDKCAKIDTIVSNLDKQISRYGDLKRSLIDEVITGKRAV